ncbi:MAG: hypothetical protein GY941_22120 [Planctomycetes bacterium]|nr:hypothetical protein [Planctomycetota bacterium]
MATESKKVQEITDTWENIVLNLPSGQDAMCTDTGSGETANRVTQGSMVKCLDDNLIVDAVQYRYDKVGDIINYQDVEFKGITSHETTQALTIPKGSWIGTEGAGGGQIYITNGNEPVNDGVLSIDTHQCSLVTKKGAVDSNELILSESQAILHAGHRRGGLTLSQTGESWFNSSNNGLDAETRLTVDDRFGLFESNTRNLRVDADGATTTNTVEEYNVGGPQIIVTKAILENEIAGLPTPSLQAVTDVDPTTTNEITIPSLNIVQDDTPVTVGQVKYNAQHSLRIGNPYIERLEAGLTLAAHFVAEENITKGQVLRAQSTATVGNLGASLARGDSYNENWVLGVATNDAVVGGIVGFLKKGVIEGVDTSLLDAKVPLYICETPGQLTDERPPYPCKPYIIGTVIVKDAVNGVIGVDIQPDQYQHQFDGCIVEKHDYTIVVEGTKVFCDVEKDGGGDLPIQLNSSVAILDCTTGEGVGGKARVELIQGTSDTLVENLVHIARDVNGDPQLYTTASYPTHSGFAIVGTISINDYATVTSVGAMQNRRTTSAISHGGNGQNQHLIERFSIEPPKWDEGCTPTAAINTGANPDIMNLSTLAGVVYQTHRQTMPALSVVTNGIYVANGSGGSSLDNFVKLNNLYDAAGYTSNSTESRDTTARGVLVVFGCINKTTAECKLFVNLPRDLYGTNSNQIDNCYYDTSNTADFTVPDELSKTAFLIAQVPYYISGNSISFNTLPGTDEIINLLGTPIGRRGGASGTGSFTPNIGQVLTEGTDAQTQKIENLGDATADGDALNKRTGDGWYAPITHTHAIGNVTGLQTELDGKVSLTGDETVGGIKTLTGNGVAPTLKVGGTNWIAPDISGEAMYFSSSTTNPAINGNLLVTDGLASINSGSEWGGVAVNSSGVSLAGLTTIDAPTGVVPTLRLGGEGWIAPKVDGETMYLSTSNTNPTTSGHVLVTSGLVGLVPDASPTSCSIAVNSSTISLNNLPVGLPGGGTDAGAIRVTTDGELYIA